MKKFALIAAAAGAFALAGCGSSEDASEDAMADTVEMPADEAMADVPDPVADSTPEAVEEATEEATATAEEAADAALDTVADIEAAAQEAEAETARAQSACPRGDLHGRAGPVPCLAFAWRRCCSPAAALARMSPGRAR